MTPRNEFEQFVIEQLMAMRGQLASLETKVDNPVCPHTNEIEDLKSWKSKAIALWAFAGFLALGGFEGIRYIIKTLKL